ncbi:MAG: HAD hydrolase family protein [Micromonosporaceae bacterium]|nr:HAD hydrolase family protein [Micromonosporaceae bacterium]
MVRLDGGLPRLVATDLDGTLVRGDHTVSRYTTDVLAKVREAGITLVGITGRGPRLIDLCNEHIAGAHFLVLSQGGYVVDLDHGGPPRVLSRIRMQGAAVGEAVRLIEAEVGLVQLVTEALDHPNAPLWGEAGVRWPYPEALEVRERADALAAPLFKAFVRAPDLNSDELLKVARCVVPPSLCAATHSGLEFVELCPPGMTKASGLAVVADALGVNAEQTLVFGDMPNDVPMFAWAGRGVAVANAHEELLAVADDVTGTNDEDGVAHYLDRLLTA